MNNKSILIIDDDIEFIKSLTDVLNHEGYKVENTKKLGDALEKLLENDLSLIIINLQLPTNGNAFFNIRKIDKNVPIITVTGNDSIDMQRSVRQKGVFFYFVKPFKMDDIKIVVNSAMASEHTTKKL